MNGLTTVYDTKVIESGCVSGEDQYATSIRKSNRPEQTVSVIGEKGLICLYDIQLDWWITILRRLYTMENYGN